MKLNWARFNKYLYKYWKIQATVIFIGLITVPLGLLNPYLTKLVIDKAYGQRDLRLFFILAVIGASAFLLNGLISSFNSYLTRLINRRVSFDITKDLFRHLQKLPLSFFDNRSTGEHIYRLNADAQSVSDFVCNTAPQIITLLPRLLLILIIVLYLNWRLALLAALLVPVTYIHPYLFGRWLKEITRKTILKSQNIFKELQEVFSHIHLIKALGKEKREITKFEESLKKRMSLELKNAKVSNIGSFSNSMVNKALSGTIALYGGYQVIKGTMTLGSLTAIMIYLMQLTGLLKSIGSLYQAIIINSVTRHRLSEILDIKTPIFDAEDAVSYNLKEGRIEFRNVYFGYKKKRPVLENISFEIEPSAKVALIGPSGCGKSTILSIIMRLYGESGGSILIDGMNVKRIKLDSLKSRMGAALQEPFLWNDTIANNILYGAEGGTRDDAMRAAKLSLAHSFIMDFPNRYDSVIGEMACKISEGQKQRIALARALIRKPKILILDEAMSSLDSETEDAIVDNIKSELGDSTVIAVSHRLSTVKKMDLVYFLESGSKITRGTHQELIEKNPRYAELFASQVDEEMAYGVQK